MKQKQPTPTSSNKTEHWQHNTTRSSTEQADKHTERHPWRNQSTRRATGQAEPQPDRIQRKIAWGGGEGTPPPHHNVARDYTGENNRARDHNHTKRGRPVAAPHQSTGHAYHPGRRKTAQVATNRAEHSHQSRAAHSATRAHRAPAPRHDTGDNLHQRTAQHNTRGRTTHTTECRGGGEVQRKSRRGRGRGNKQTALRPRAPQAADWRKTSGAWTRK